MSDGELFQITNPLIIEEIKQLQKQAITALTSLLRSGAKMKMEHPRKRVLEQNPYLDIMPQT